MFDEILERTLKRASKELDKREGSIIYDSLAPICFELAEIYALIDELKKESYAETASREYLIKRARERGILPKNGTAPIYKATLTPTIKLPIGTKFRSIREEEEEGTTFSIVEHIEDRGNSSIYKIESDKKGRIFEPYIGAIVPTEYIEGLATAVITECLSHGENEEETESIRKRYFMSLRGGAFGGNKADYIAKTLSIDGVGAVKVTPVHNGGGTVLINILNSEYQPANTELIKKVQDIIDPQPQGQGLGIAPISHIVTVDTVKTLMINIKTSLTLKTNTQLQDIKASVISTINNYFLEIRKAWQDTEREIIRISQINTRLAQIDGVIDVQATTLNDNTDNLVLDGYTLPILGDFKNV